MSERSGYFKSISGDRIYTADDFARRFRDFISNGIIVVGGSDLTDELEVTSDDSDMFVDIALGKANIRGYFYELYDSAESLELTEGDLINPRIDRIVLEMNLADSERLVKLKVLTGTPAGTPSAPTLTQTDTTYQLSLAQILIPATATVVLNSNITDERTDDTVCGLANYTIGTKPLIGNDAEVINVADDNKVYSGLNVEDVLIELGSSIQGAASISTTVTETSDTVTTIDTLANSVLFTRVTITETSPTVTTINNKIYESDGTTIKYEYNDVITETSDTVTDIVRTVI